MELKIRINDKMTLLLNVDQEMNIGEFMGITQVIGKIDKYALNQRNVVNEIRGTRKTYSAEEKLRMMNEWAKASKKERQAIATKQGISKTQYAKTIYYFKRTMGGKK